MLAVVSSTPAMLEDAHKLAAKVSLRKPKKISQIVIAGMGGSAISGNIISDLLLGKSRVPIYVNRNYRVPAFVNGETLFFAISYSGNTEETLAAVKEASARGAKIICVTADGKLKDLALAESYPLYLVPPGHQPRAALPHLLVPVLYVLEQTGIYSGLRQDLDETAALLRKLTAEYGPEKPLRGNPVKQLAKKLQGKIPLVLGTTGTTESAALRLKAQFNENSKVTTVFGLFPEMNHNEIVNLSELKREEHNFAAIFLRDERDVERVKKRMAITKSFIGRQLGGVSEISALGKSALANILSLIYFGDFLSVYLAILRGVDPSSVEAITRFKRELSR